jgi:hypothetical protein
MQRTGPAAANQLCHAVGVGASARIHGRRLKSNTSGRPRTHSAQWRQRPRS